MKLKQVFEILLPQKFWDNFNRKKDQEMLVEWKENGCPIPPPHIVKQEVIQEYQSTFNYPVLIETGTYKGDMIEAQKEFFSQIYSIELSEKLHKKAVKRFRKNKKIKIVQGDSGKVLPSILNEIDENIIFWLDGHWSEGITARGEKDCPIFEEIDAIFNHSKKNHVLLVDDARRFNGKGDYPTIDQLSEYIQSKNSEYQVQVVHDIIRYVVK